MDESTMEELPRQRSRDDQPHPMRAVEDLRTINEFALSLLTPTAPEDLLWVIAEKIGTVLGFEDCVLYLVEGDELVQRAAFGVKSKGHGEIVDPIIIPIGSGIVGEVAESGVSRVVRDTRKEASYIPDKFCGLSELTVPISFEGRVIGIIDSECSRVDGYSDTDLEMVEWIANIAASRIATALADRDRRVAQEELRLANESLEERIRVSTEELAEALGQVHRAQLLESVGQLAAGMAHDLNNILTTIQGNIALAQMDTPDVGELHDALDASAHSCREARELSSRLLALADGGAPNLKASRGIPDLIREMTSKTLDGLDLECEIQLADDLPAVEFDAVQMGHVICNLVQNACQAMPEGGELQIVGRVIGEEASSAWVELEVHDSGPGVADEHRERVFDPYFTTLDGHVGLGLTVAQSIMARHGGSLELLPGTGTGAVFRLRLPASRQQEAKVSQEAAPVRGASVLVMDDEPGIRVLLERILPKLGHSVTTTASGDEALLEFHRHAASGRSFDVVILDLTVPGGMGGIKTLEALRRSDPHIRAIVMSGYSSDGALADSKRHGFQAALAKPFTAADLSEVLDGVFGPDADPQTGDSDGTV
ncbi:MAG: ATP-binding protein [Planctomycetota bacterium]|nr:ATP-binding protein [Planctomycetota bacterium]